MYDVTFVRIISVNADNVDDAEKEASRTLLELVSEYGTGTFDIFTEKGE